MADLTGLYENLKKDVAKDLGSAAVSESLSALIRSALGYLRSRCRRADLTSLVSGKTYFAFVDKTRKHQSRAVNSELFDFDLTLEHVDAVASAELSSSDRAAWPRILYTSAISYCCAIDVQTGGRSSTPGTYFQWFVGHLFSKKVGVPPEMKSPTLNPEFGTGLPTDHVFDLGKGRSNLHVPVKITTRERAAQAWVHQRILDGAFGVNRIKGVFVVMSETNRVKRRGVISIQETCVPEQWRLYQMFVAQLHRIYYFDVPAPYAALAKSYPFIQIKAFPAFFDEHAALASANPWQ